MEHEFWHERWRRNEIGFHESQTHDMLASHWPRVAQDSSAPVFVPLCGKSLDMLWLAGRGHDVTGVELSDIALEDFFTSAGIAPRSAVSGAFTLYKSAGYRMWCGDFFELGSAQMPPATLFYDRASLIALPRSLRERYARHLLSLLAPGARGLLITLQYDIEDLAGPPFNVSLDEIEDLFGTDCTVEHLEHSESTVKGRFVVQQTATCLTLRP